MRLTAMDDIAFRRTLGALNASELDLNRALDEIAKRVASLRSDPAQASAWNMLAHDVAEAAALAARVRTLDEMHELIA